MVNIFSMLFESIKGKSIPQISLTAAKVVKTALRTNLRPWLMCRKYDTTIFVAQRHE